MNFAPKLLLAIAMPSCLGVVTDALSHVATQPQQQQQSAAEPRFLFNLTSGGTLEPVVNKTSIAMSTGVATVIGLGLLSVLNNYIVKATEMESKSIGRTIQDHRLVFAHASKYVPLKKYLRTVSTIVRLVCFNAHITLSFQKITNFCMASENKPVGQAARLKLSTTTFGPTNKPWSSTTKITGSISKITMNGGRNMATPITLMQGFFRSGKHTKQLTKKAIEYRMAFLTYLQHAKIKGHTRRISLMKRDNLRWFSSKLVFFLYWYTTFMRKVTTSTFFPFFLQGHSHTCSIFTHM